MTIEEEVIVAYRKLKQHIYFDKNDLVVRKKLADFECNESFPSSLQQISNVVQSDKPTCAPEFKAWLEQIDFRVVPKRIKSIDADTQSNANFISNVTSADAYNIEKVNYFFDGPIELQVISAFWLMKQGYLLDRQLSRNCYGARLHNLLGSPHDRSLHLYQKYHHRYSKWRDDAISKAKELLTKQKQNVYILGLDLKEYFYRIKLNYSKIIRRVADEKEPNYDPELGEKLLQCLEQIAKVFRQKISECLTSTHEV